MSIYVYILQLKIKSMKNLIDIIGIYIVYILFCNKLFYIL